jgi:hypothetical protein
MGRQVVGFVLGLLFGFVGVQMACQAVVYFTEGPDVSAAEERNMSLPEYRRWVDLRYERPFLLVSLAGAVVCGVACAYALNVPVRAAARPARRRAGADDPLTREEFHQVLQACLMVPLDQRGPEYVRGLVVGRLAEAAPALAHKVDGFSDRHMAALHSDLRHRQSRLGRG